jgi:hypothetical protein
MATSKANLGPEDYPKFLLDLKSEISVDLKALVSQEERKAITERFIQTCQGKFAYATEAARQQDPFFRLLVRNDLNYFFNGLYGEGRKPADLSDDALGELESGLCGITLRKAHAFWDNVNEWTRIEAFRLAVGTDAIKLRAILSGYRTFVTSKKSAPTFSQYFARSYKWSLLTLLKKTSTSDGDELVSIVDPAELAGFASGDSARAAYLRLVRQIPTQLSRDPEYSEWRGYLRWLGLFCGWRCPIRETYFLLVTGAERRRVRQRGRESRVLNDRLLQQLLECIERRKLDKPAKDGEFEQFLVGEAIEGRLDISPDKVPVLLDEFDRFCAQRVRNLARPYFPDGKKSLWVKAAAELIEALKTFRDSSVRIQPYHLISVSMGLTPLDVVVLDRFRLALNRIYKRQGDFWESFAKRSKESLDGG